MKTTTKQAILGGALVLAALLALAACGGDGSPEGEDTHTHEWKWEVTTYATMTADGEETETCSDCGETRGTREIHSVNSQFTQNGGEAADDPITLAVKINLGDMADNSGWQELLAAIETAGKYVILDLSASTMTGTEFNPYSDTPCGEEWVTEMILPDTATKIADGYRGTYENSYKDRIKPFGNFTRLTSVSGDSITDVGDCAFTDCIVLKNINLPSATSIGELAFLGCIVLKSVSLPSATSLGEWAFLDAKLLENINLPVAIVISESAFDGCDALKSVSLPSATSINDRAFCDCTALKSVSLPSATSIDERAFEGCTSLESVTLGASAPTVGTRIFNNMTTPQTVTVHVPQGAMGYGESPTNTTGENWGNAFRGKGWDGTDYLTGTVNASITLVIVYGE